MLLRSRFSRKGRPGCPDCLGSAEVLKPIAQRQTGSASLMAILMSAAELGRVPDKVIRFGIRRLLKSRLRSLQSTSHAADAGRFVRQTLGQPIAVQSAAANEQHYEVPAAFFQQVLGPRLKYSSCYWPAGVTTLEQAEDAALRETCDHAGLENGMNVLELGCGWGSLSLWMARNFPLSQITSVSNSNSQRQFIVRRARDLGLSNLKVITADMNDFQTEDRFDRVLSVEMFEHMRNHRALTDRIHSWLRPEGRLLVHIFCHRDSTYLFETDGPQNWMGRHFFTGGMMPGVDLLPEACQSMNLAQHWKWNGIHYAKTCRAWLNNQDEAAQQLQKTFADTYGASGVTRWHNRWRLFFMACEELFAFNRGEEWFVSHYLFQK